MRVLSKIYKNKEMYLTKCGKRVMLQDFLERETKIP